MRRSELLSTEYSQNTECLADRVTSSLTTLDTTPAAKDQRLHRGDVVWEHNIGLRLSSPGRSVVVLVFIWLLSRFLWCQALKQQPPGKRGRMPWRSRRLDLLDGARRTAVGRPDQPQNTQNGRWAC